LVFLREHPEQTALVHVARAAHDPITLPADQVPGATTGAPAYGPGVGTDGRGDLVLDAEGPLVRVWTWSTRAPEWEVSR
ncbi:MAG: glycoside hydrolase family 13 protein, partial [Actinomycetales bacterium]|nr:glycoside hydrolase family 13 protein [Actinomycetales bacterium]